MGPGTSTCGATSVLRTLLANKIFILLGLCPMIQLLTYHSVRGRALPDVDVHAAPTPVDHIRLAIDRGVVTGEEAELP